MQDPLAYLLLLSTQLLLQLTVAAGPSLAHPISLQFLFGQLDWWVNDGYLSREEKGPLVLFLLC